MKEKYIRKKATKKTGRRNGFFSPLLPVDDTFFSGPEMILSLTAFIKSAEQNMTSELLALMKEAHIFILLCAIISMLAGCLVSTLVGKYI